MHKPSETKKKPAPKKTKQKPKQSKEKEREREREKKGQLNSTQRAAIATTQGPLLLGQRPIGNEPFFLFFISFLSRHR
jgi:hypothetical protein